MGMNLQEFLHYISLPIQRYGNFLLVAGVMPSTASDDKLDPASENIIDVYADDDGNDIVLLMADGQEKRAANAMLLTVRELERKLMSLANGRLGYAVGCSYSKPNTHDWRLDLPVCGSGINEQKGLYALFFSTQK
jgi:hypothetical protein